MSKWSEEKIAAILARWFLKYRDVVIPNTYFTGYECDLLTVTSHGKIIDFEIKISRADFKADAKKSKWWKDREAGFKREHPPMVWKHYFVMPEEIWKPELIEFLPSQKSGIILIPEDPDWIEPVYKVKKRATPDRSAKKIPPEAMLKIARLANIRMWEAIHSRNASVNEASDLRTQLKEAKA